MTLPILETKRLLLGPVSEDHVAALHRLWTDSEVRRHLWDDDIISDDIISLERAAAVIQASVDLAEREGLGMWVLYEKVDHGSVIGFVALRHPAESSEVEILYGLRPGYWGKGLATEASMAALQYAFNVLRLPRVLGGANTPNTKSFSIMRRLGMLPLESGVPGVPGAIYFAVEATRFDVVKHPNAISIERHT